VSTPSSLCLVSPSHLANNPRVVKEADALSAAGHQVTVVCGRNDAAVDAFDSRIEADRAWRVRRVDHTRRAGTLSAEALHRLARLAVRVRGGCGPALARLAEHRAAGALAAAAAVGGPDLIIGHTVAGLAAAGVAAARTGARLGFDAEDFHTEETDAATRHPVLRPVIAAIERHWLPRCQHLTAASPLIAEALRSRYGIPSPTVVLNVFPLSEAPAAPHPGSAPGQPARLHWVSQTIGPGRGLERLVPVLARLRHRVVVTLRGRADPAFVSTLRMQAAAEGVGDCLVFEPPAAPGDLARIAADSDLGLGLEESVPRNRDLCLTNKIFLSLLGGVPVALTPTSAQRPLAADLREAALLVDLTDPEGAAKRLDSWLLDPEARRTARSRAWELARTRYCWDVESALVIAGVARTLALVHP
jgi:glycosyltransferase involved in cell wall biosynthesis